MKVKKNIFSLPVKVSQLIVPRRSTTQDVNVSSPVKSSWGMKPLVLFPRGQCSCYSLLPLISFSLDAGTHSSSVSVSTGKIITLSSTFPTSHTTPSWSTRRITVTTTGNSLPDCTRRPGHPNTNPLKSADYWQETVKTMCLLLSTIKFKVQKFYRLPTQYVCMLHTDLTITSRCFPV